MKTLITIIGALLLAACQPAPALEAPPELAEESLEQNTQPTAIEASTCITDFDSETDYFPEKSTTEYAAGFQIEYFNYYKVITVLTPYPGATDTLQYVLVQCGAPTPEDIAAEVVVEVPASTLVATSTTYIAHLDTLGLLDQLAGLDSFQYVNNPAVRERIDNGDLVEVSTGSEVNVEAVIDLDPSLYMTYTIAEPIEDAFPVLVEAGLPLVVNSSWTEPTPLGRSEWIKFMGAFYNVEAQANAAFDEIESQYLEASEVAQAAERAPTVFLNDPFEGVWYMSSGTSYQAQLLADAGANYLWADTDNAGSLQLDVETVFDVAQEADYWVNVGAQSLEELGAIDERFTQFAAYQNGDVWTNTKRQTEFGNEYFETGVANPHLILMDLVKIFHSELMADHEFVYYQQVQ